VTELPRPRFVLSAGRLLLASLCVAAPAAAAPAGAMTGAITGTVVFQGDAPERAPERRDTDPVCAKIPGMTDDVVVTNVRDVVVRLKGAALPAAPAPTAPVVITQHGCSYSPHVVAAVAGQKVAIRNGDPTFHNVRAVASGKPLFNLPHPAEAPELLRDTGAAGEVMELRCDVHPWMHAYVVVHDHAHFAVTGEDGTFTLPGLPPGTYTVEAWHPVLGTREVKVKVGAGKHASATATLAYRPAAAGR
jgi:plastocyanin